MLTHRPRRPRPSGVIAPSRRHLAGVALIGAVVLASSQEPRLFGPLPLIGVPGDIVLCGRSYDGSSAPLRTLPELTAGDVPPLIVDPWLHADCVPGACSGQATDAPCATVIHVPAGQGRFLGYSLRGGP